MDDKDYPSVHESNDYHEMKAERRRYALLQAAATVLAGSYYTTPEGSPQVWENFNTAVDAAELMLTEIEKREVKP